MKPWGKGCALHRDGRLGNWPSAGLNERKGCRRQFCANCHQTVAEHLACFQCHASVPKGPQPSAIAGAGGEGEGQRLAMVHGGKVDLQAVQQQGGK